MENMIITERDLAMKQVLQNKIDGYLKNKGQDIKGAIDKISATGAALSDYIVDTKALRFDAVGNTVAVSFEDNEGIVHCLNLNEHSITQLGERLDHRGFPIWLRNCLNGSAWERNSAAFALNEYALNHSRERFLLRDVDGTARAFLSDSYKRLNTMEIFVSFLEASAVAGCFLVNGHSGTSKDFLEVINPVLRTIVTPNNGVVFMASGARLRNSDFGDGALELSQFNLLPICLNGAVGQKIMREVHLGSKLPANIVFANDTVKKDTEARALMVRDVIKQLWHPAFMEAEEAQIISASGKLIDVQNEVKRLPKLGLLKSESEEVLKVLINRNPEDGVAGTPSLWSLAQAVGAIARDKAPERMRDLQEIAGAMIYTKPGTVVDAIQESITM